MKVLVIIGVIVSLGLSASMANGYFERQAAKHERQVRDRNPTLECDYLTNKVYRGTVTSALKLGASLAEAEYHGEGSALVFKDTSNCVRLLTVVQAKAPTKYQPLVDCMNSGEGIHDLAQCVGDFNKGLSEGK